MSQITIEKALPDSADAVRYLAHLSSQNGHCVGFLPFAAYKQAVERNHVRLLRENGQLAGYLINGPYKKLAKIYQICITEELRRIEFGTALLDDFLIDAINARSQQMSLWCADDLEANDFWRAMGCHFYGRRLRNKRKTRWQNRYLLDLPEKEIADARETATLQVMRNSGITRLLARGDTHLARKIINARQKNRQR